MYASEILRDSAFPLAASADVARRLIAQVRSLLLRSGSPDRARAFHDVLRLDAVSTLGETPAAYGWHVDALLNVRLNTAHEPVRAVPELTPGFEDPTPRERGVKARVYRIRRAKRHPRLVLLQGGLAGDAA
jgi:hypothetical protein